MALDFEALRVTGVEVNYFFICRRKLWLFSRKLAMESTSDQVYLGRLLHETSYQYKSPREVLVDNLIKIDVAEGGEKVHEVKLSRKMEQAHRYQLLYYLYFLKQLGITGLVGEINYPRLRRKEEVRLLPEQEAFLEKALEQIQQVKSLATPPEAQLTSLCRRCSYQELCWG